MNLSTVVTRIKLKLGLFNIATPFEDLDEVIVEILKTITLPVFSLYNPYREDLTIKTRDLELLEKTAEYEKYLLPDFRTRELLYVIDVRYDTGTMAGLGSYGTFPRMSGGLYEHMMIANAGANLLNGVIPKITFKFIKPRTILLYNVYAYTNIIMELGFKHDESLASIPQTASESFMKLALLDVKENLYPTIKQYTELNTSIGTINLKLDDWADAESRRDELINQWDEVAHFELKPVYYL